MYSGRSGGDSFGTFGKAREQNSRRGELWLPQDVEHFRIDSRRPRTVELYEMRRRFVVQRRGRIFCVEINLECCWVLSSLL